MSDKINAMAAAREYPDVPTKGFWVGEGAAQKLWWQIGDEQVSDADLRSWCGANLQGPYNYVGATVLQLHTKCWAHREALLRK